MLRFRHSLPVNARSPDSLQTSPTGCLSLEDDPLYSRQARDHFSRCELRPTVGVFTGRPLHEATLSEAVYFHQQCSEIVHSLVMKKSNDLCTDTVNYQTWRSQLATHSAKTRSSRTTPVDGTLRTLPSRF